jgi:DnaJ-class molecular chaperone
MGCQKCHHQIQAEPLITPHGSYLESSWINCQTCHSADAETRSKYYQCSQCHQSNVENIADETLSSKVVVHKSCWECHKTGKGVKASESCGTCHQKQQQAMETAVEDGSPKGVSGRGEPAAAAH